MPESCYYCGTSGFYDDVCELHKKLHAPISRLTIKAAKEIEKLTLAMFLDSQRMDPDQYFAEAARNIAMGSALLAMSRQPSDQLDLFENQLR